ncbi:MAG TPA: histidine phosphatase family protein [Polyangiaceae bacterium]|jgi:broad specificity phosphatase PhoE|nr:histidine phosphatase family protein [Polyangiaceae bacterium]
MLTIKLVRHGESEANVGRVSSLDIGDHAIPLSENGSKQALEAGRTIGQAFLDGALVYTSPYRRTRQTLAGILEGAGVAKDGVRVYEDPRLREVEHGYEEVAAQEELRKVHGWFYYRFRGGESPADCYDRTSNFLESMMRQAERKSADRVLIVTHGLTIRCFVMRFLHSSVEEFDRLANPQNCAIVTIAERAKLAACQFSSGSWGVEGLAMRPAV